MMSIVELLRLRQGSEQPVQTFLAQVKANARQCNLKVKCTCDNMVDYSEHMVLHQLLVRLADDENQEDLLALDTITLIKAEKTKSRYLAIRYGSSTQYLKEES